MGFIVLTCLVLIGYFIGSKVEKDHYQSLKIRENKFRSIPVISGKLDTITTDKDHLFVSGGVVIAADYFKSFVYSIRNFFGGRVKVYETLIDRARREAILRMKEQAINWGAEEIINLKIETSNIKQMSNKKGASPAIEVFAYATAFKKRI